MGLLLRMIFILILLSAKLGVSEAQSVKNIPSPLQKIKTRAYEGKIYASNLGIQNIVVGDQTLQDVIDVFGPADCFRCKEQAPLSVCYLSMDESDNTAILFKSLPGKPSKFKKIRSFYLGPKEVINDCESFCVQSKFVSKKITTESGISIGMNKSNFMKVLGKPTKIIGDILLYHYEIKDRLPENILNLLQQKAYEIFGPDYKVNPNYYITSTVQAYFFEGKLVWFFASKVESQ